MIISILEFINNQRGTHRFATMHEDGRTKDMNLNEEGLYVFNLVYFHSI